MATTLMGVKIQNTVYFKENINSRKKAFASLAKYKKEVMGIKTQLMGLGNIKIKVDGLDKVKTQLAQVKSQAAKAVRQPVRTGGVGTNMKSDFVGAPRPPMQGSVKKAADEAKRLDKILSFELLPNFRALYKEERNALSTKLKSLKTTREVSNEIKRQTARLKEQTKLRKDITRQMNKQNFAQERSTNSMKQMVGAAFSVFTAMESIGAIARTGMEMQKVSATMLSVSKDSNEAKENMTFLRKEAHRLGMDRVKAGRAFSKILAARGELSLEESKKLFTGVSEAGVVSGTSADEMSLQVKALAQMLGKTTVMSEELKLQLG